RAVERSVVYFFFQAEDGIRDFHVTGVQTCALPISTAPAAPTAAREAAAARAGRTALRRRATRRCGTAPARSRRSSPNRRRARPRSEERRVGKECRARQAAAALTSEDAPVKPRQLAN